MDNSTVQPPIPQTDQITNNLINNPIKPPKNHKNLILIIGLLLIVLVGVAILLLNSSSSMNSKHDSKSLSCINKNFSTGSSGNCVSDIQTMVNFLETNNLNECPFTGSEPLIINGQYSKATETQVGIVQNWLNCYNKQEEFPVHIVSDGMVASSTWSGLCTYAYIYPKQAGESSSPYFKQTLIAGKNAGC